MEIQMVTFCAVVDREAYMDVAFFTGITESDCFRQYQAKMLIMPDRWFMVS